MAVDIKLVNKTGLPYAEVRDRICKALVGNKAFIEDDILVSDALQDSNAIHILLAGYTKDEIDKSERAPLVTLTGEISSAFNG